MPLNEILPAPVIITRPGGDTIQGSAIASTTTGALVCRTKGGPVVADANDVVLGFAEG